MLLAFDDTDGPDGGCTTAVTFAVLEALPDLALLEPPRLVRLNPNAPWKTRGNGAVALRLGRARGRRVRVGEWLGRPVHAYPEGEDVPPTQEHLERAWAAIEVEGRSHGASPAMVALTRRPNERLYWDAVQRLVPLDAIPNLPSARWAGDGRGRIGCLAALAWRARRTSYELLAYRIPAQLGRPRAIDPAALAGLDERGLYATYDHEAGRPACIPNTPCPVLVGLRARRATPLWEHGLPALRRAAREPVAGWLMWLTNQASGDHVVARPSLNGAWAGMTIQVPLRIVGDPRSRRGGHVFVEAEDDRNHVVDLAAFEPSKQFRRVLSGLRPGDAVVAVGAWSPRTANRERAVIRVERLQLAAPAAVSIKIHNPVCDVCDVAMKSMGKGAGYKCPRCRQRVREDAATYEDEARDIGPGWHEPPVMARRHLHRPLAWM